jgi:hypothetical protein
MQNSSSDGNRESRDRSSRPRSQSRGGSRSGGSGGSSRNRRSGGGSRERGPREDGEPSSSRPPRGSGRREHENEIIARNTGPRPTGFQKFVKFITFGLVDLTAKKPSSPKKSPRPPRDASSAAKKERRAPLIVEPTTPRLYVGNLSYDVTSADLTALFSAHGTVAEAAIVTQPGSDRSKGFAFVEMSSVEEAKAASSALNDKDFQGRQMLVTGAKSEGRSERGEGERSRERAPRSGGRGEERRSDGRGKGGRGERGRSGERDEIEKPSRQVKPLQIEVVTSPSLNVVSLNAEATDLDVSDLFSGIGTIVLNEEAGANGDGLTKNLRIDLTDTAEAQKAVELLDGKCFMGHQIRVTGVKTEA